MANGASQNPVSLSAIIEELAKTDAPDRVTTIQERVAQASGVKNQELGTDRVIAAGIRNNNDIAQAPAVQPIAERDMGGILNHGTLWDAARIYAQENDLERIENTPRSFDQVLADTARGIGTGAANGIAGLAAMGLDAVEQNPSLAAMPGNGIFDALRIANRVGLQSEDVSATAQAVTENIQNSDSTPLQESREYAALRGALNAEDSVALYERDLENQDAFSAGLNRVLRDFGWGVADLAQDPKMAGDATAQGVGSLVASGGISAPLRQMTASATLKARGLADDTITRFLGTTAGQRFEAAIARANTAATASGIGLQEAGGAFMTAQIEVLGMSEEDLFAGSEDYTGLRQQGMTHEEAQSEIAKSAARSAAAMQGVIGAATGLLVGRLEGNPLGSARKLGQSGTGEAVRELGGAVLREGAEEALQGGSAAAVNNAAIRQFADADRDILDGVGADAASGVVAGAGMAGVLRGPQVATEAARDAVRAAGQGALLTATAAGRVVDRRLQELAGRAEEGAGVGQAAMGAAADRTHETLAQASEALGASSTQDAPPETETVSGVSLEDLKERVDNALVTRSEELFGRPKALLEGFFGEEALEPGTAFNRSDLIKVAQDNLTKDATEFSQVQRDELALWLFDQEQTFELLRDQDLSRIPEEIKNLVEEAVTEFDTVLANPKIKEAITAARKIEAVDFGKMPEITPQSVESPEVKAAVGQMSSIALANPVGVDPAYVDQILDHRVALNISDSVARRLKAAAALALESQQAADEKAKATESAQELATSTGETLKKTRDIVRQEIEETGGDKESHLSLTQHMAGIVGAVHAGRNEEAQTKLNALRNFGQHMLNKLAAADASAKLNRSRDNRVPYETWTGSKFLKAQDKQASSIYIAPGSANSRLTAEEVFIDAKSVSTLYNNLLEIYGDMFDGEKLATATRIEFPTQAPKPQAQTKPQTPSAAQNAEAAAEGVEQSAETQKEPQEKPKESTNEDENPEAGETEKDVEQAVENSPQEIEKPEPEAAEPKVVKAEAAPENANEESAEETADSEATPEKTIEPVAGSQGELIYEFDLNRAPILASENAIAETVERIRAGAATGKLEGIDYAVDAEKARKFTDLIEQVSAKIIGGMNARLKEPAKDFRKGSLTPLDALKHKMDFRQLASGRVLNLVDPDKGVYRRELLEVATLAAIHWAIGNPSEAQMDVEDVAKMFGVAEVDVTPTMQMLANRGLRGKTAQESLARTIMDFWGAKSAKDTDLKLVRGVVEGLAAELIDQMDEVLVTKLKIKDQKSYLNIEMRADATHEAVREIGYLRALLGDLLAPQNSKKPYIGTPPETVRNNQKGSKNAKLGAKMRSALKEHQNIAFFRNTPFVDFLQALGKESYVDLMGGEGFDPAVTNVNDAASKEGKRRGLLRSFEETMLHDESVTAYADAKDIDRENVPTFYQWYVVSNERIHAEGFSGQSDKTMREAYASTMATLDLTVPENVEAFWLTVAQSADLAKTEKVSREVAVQTAQDAFGEKFSASTEVVRNWLETGQLDENAAATLKDELGEGASPKLLHAIIAVAQYINAVDEGEESLKTFQHALALEADGKTDGPINALMHWNVGPWTAEDLASLAKGGFFPGAEGKTLNDHIQSEDPIDLYEEATHAFYAALGELKNSLSGTKAGPVAHALFQVIDELTKDKDFQYDAKTGEMVIGRNTLKNPLTITVYGSSAKGIASKVTRGILDVFYARISEQLQGEAAHFDESFSNALGRVVTSRAYQYKGDWSVSNSVRDGAKLVKVGMPEIKNGTDFTMPKRNVQMLEENILHLFVNPMVEGISSTMGGAQQTAQVFVQASSVQAFVFKALFENAVAQALAGKEKNAHLSQQEYDDIFAELRKYGAVIEDVAGDAHTLDLSGTERAATEYEFATSMNGEFRGGGSLPGPKDPGVAIAPLMTISRGDAMMMVNYFTDRDIEDDAKRRVLPVFDGLEMPADRIDDISVKINEAVSRMWEDNPAKDVTESFKDWLRQGGMQKMSPEQQITLGTSVLGLSEDTASVGAVEASVKALAETLEDISEKSQARKNTLKRIEYSVDHMASGERAYTSAGEKIEGAVLDRMNEIYADELEKIRRDKQEEGAKSSTAPEDSELVERVKKLGKEHESLEVWTVSAGSLPNLLSGKTVPADHKRLAKALKSGLPDFQVHFGAPSELERLKEGQSEDTRPIGLGQIDLSSGNIYIANIASETVLHEMLHAATARVIADFYGTQQDVTETQSKALRNLEKLMHQFVEMDFTTEDSTGASVALLTGQTQIGQLLQAGENVAALSEFISWSLTNEHIARTLKKSRVHVRLENLVRGAVNAVKRLLGIPQNQSMSVFAQVAINTVALTQEAQALRPLGLSEIPGALNQTVGQGVSARVTALGNRIDRKISAHLAERAKDRPLGDPEGWRAKKAAQRVKNVFVGGGFDFGAEEGVLFEKLATLFATSANLNGASVTKIEKYFKHVLEHLTPTDLQEQPTIPSVYDYRLGEQRLETLAGERNEETDGYDRTLVLAGFVAASQTSDVLRRALKTIPPIKGEKIGGASMDDVLSSAGNRMIDDLAAALTKEGKNSNAQGALDALTLSLAQIEGEAETAAERKLNDLLESGNNKSKALVNRGGQWLIGLSDAALKEERTEGRKTAKSRILKTASLIGRLAVEEEGKNLGEIMTRAANTSAGTPTPLKELLIDVLGMTDSNKGVLGLVNKVKYAVSSARQDYREELPKILAEKFSRKLEKYEWADMFNGMAKTDLASLGKILPAGQIVRLITSPGKLQNTIEGWEAELLAAAGAANFGRYQQKAKELAHFMVTGETQTNELLRNARAIVLKVGGGKTVEEIDGVTVSLVDQLTTLYALKMQPKSVMKSLRKLADTEEEGVEFILHYLGYLREMETQKEASSNGVSLINGYKGYIPSEARQGSNLIVADDTEAAYLEQRGYTRLGTYDGSAAERGKKGYYFSNVAGAATYNQGVMQTVSASSFGVDPLTGRTVGASTAGVIKGDALDALKLRLRTKTGAKPGEHLMPVFDEEGEIIAYERAMAPRMAEKLKRNEDLSKMVGAWAGRQVEEKQASEFNEVLVDALHQNWEEGRKAGRRDEYVNLLDPDLDDAVLKETISLMPREMRRQIEAVFDDGEFYVRRDLANNALGYRQASVTDVWTGRSRWSKEASEAISGAVTAVVGKNAYTYLKTLEAGVQAGVSFAKTTIVVRSVIVPAANIASNIMQLATNGVSMRAIAKGFPQKLTEIDAHLKGLSREIELKAEAAANRGNVTVTRRIEAELKAIAEARERLSIAPLIEAGEFATISEGLTDADASLTEGRYADWVKEQAEKLPSKFGTIGRYAAITQDTALFKGMSRAVQYGDFLAKAILYEHLLETGMQPQEAMERVSEEFVNFNLLPGRTRSYAEAMGLTWFWAFKLRSIKIAHRHMRDNPLRVLLGMAGANILPELPGISVGSPISDNMVSVWADGRLGYSVGPGMAFNAPYLNPWVNLAQ